MWPSGNCAVLVAGGVAGVVTWACATPMDVVKARLQMCGGGGRMYSGVLNCITVSVREEGMRVFFKGLLLNTVRAFPVNAVTFLSFEMLLRLHLYSTFTIAQGNFAESCFFSIGIHTILSFIEDERFYTQIFLIQVGHANSSGLPTERWLV
uniref:Solute carrier family 25 member 45 n=1 Tax=Sinocyclocheilus grahami TaxID=75366 RepID=A0A672L7B5_SINGR